MQLASPVEVEDGVEGARMSVKEVLIVDETVVSDQVHDLLVRLHSAESAESGVRKLLQHPPHHLVLDSSNIQIHSLVSCPGKTNFKIIFYPMYRVSGKFALLLGD